MLAEGALPDYNAAEAAAGRWHLLVHPGMRLLAVNGVGGDPTAMEEALRSRQSVSLRVRRTSWVPQQAS